MFREATRDNQGVLFVHFWMSYYLELAFDTVGNLSLFDIDKLISLYRQIQQ